MGHRPTYNQRLPNVLLVAAASGSGKSTFIKSLQRGRLSSEVLSALPKGCADWIAIDKRQSLFRRVQLSKREALGQIQECDITYACWQKAVSAPFAPLENLDASIETRPTLRTDLAAAKQIDVVIIRTPRDRLIDQLRRRSILWRVPPFCRTVALPFSGLLLWLDAIIPAPVARAADKVLGQRWHKATLTRCVEAKLLELYAQDDALDAIYRQFERSLKSLFGDRTASLVYVEPCADGGFRRL